jgi:hypothetical protein
MKSRELSYDTLKRYYSYDWSLLQKRTNIDPRRVLRLCVHKPRDMFGLRPLPEFQCTARLGDAPELSESKKAEYSRSHRKIHHAKNLLHRERREKRKGSFDLGRLKIDM